MSSGQNDIRPESLQAAAAGLARTAQGMADGLTDLQATINGAGNPWGNDETGTLFSAIYTQTLTSGLDALGSYVEQVGYAAAGLLRQAQELVSSDETSASRITDAGSGR